MPTILGDDYSLFTENSSFRKDEWRKITLVNTCCMRSRRDNKRLCRQWWCLRIDFFAWLSIPCRLVRALIRAAAPSCDSATHQRLHLLHRATARAPASRLDRLLHFVRRRVSVSLTEHRA